MTFQELKQKALANPKGKIVARDADGNDVCNCGNWPGTDCIRDVYIDSTEAAMRLEGNPQYIIGSPETLAALLQSDGFGHPLWFQLLPIFWFSAAKFLRMNDFIVYDDLADRGIVLMVGENGSVVYIDTR